MLKAAIMFDSSLISGEVKDRSCHHVVNRATWWEGNCWRRQKAHVPVKARRAPSLAPDAPALPRPPHGSCIEGTLRHSSPFNFIASRVTAGMPAFFLPFRMETGARLKGVHAAGIGCQGSVFGPSGARTAHVEPAQGCAYFGVSGNTSLAPNAI